MMALLPRFPYEIYYPMEFFELTTSGRSIYLPSYHDFNFSEMYRMTEPEEEGHGDNVQYPPV